VFEKDMGVRAPDQCCRRRVYEKSVEAWMQITEPQGGYTHGATDSLGHVGGSYGVERLVQLSGHHAGGNEFTPSSLAEAQFPCFPPQVLKIGRP